MICQIRKSKRKSYHDVRGVINPPVFCRINNYYLMSLRPEQSAPKLKFGLNSMAPSPLPSYNATRNFPTARRPGGLRGIRHHAPVRLILYLSIIVAVAIITYATVFIRYIGNLSLERGYEARIPEENARLLPTASIDVGSISKFEASKSNNYVLSTNNLEPDPKLSQDRGERYTSRKLLTSSSRVFTAVDEQWLHNGRVIRELSHRVLSRSIAQSNVVIVSPNFGHSAHIISENHATSSEQIEAQAKERIYPAKVAIDQGHTTHLLPTSTNFSAGWQYDSNGDVNSTSIGWILLAYFITSSPPSDQTTTASPDSTITIDDILAPHRARAWLKQTTITYMVFPVSAKATIKVSSIFENAKYDYKSDLIANKVIEIVGLTAAETLLELNYKLQLLASSHYFDRDDDRGGDEKAYYYGPNALFKSANDLHRFLYERLTHVLQIEADKILSQHNYRNEQIMTMEDDDLLEVHFHSLLFATQGLDLAIPSRFSYVDVGKHDICNDGIGRKKRCDPKIGARALDDNILLECPKHHDSLSVQFFDPDKDKIGRKRMERRTDLEIENKVIIDIIHTQYLKETAGVDLWMGGSSPKEAEAVCVREGKFSLAPKVSCTTRIIPQDTAKPTAPDAETNPDKPNLIVILIDPLSKKQMSRSLPNTYALLKMMGFVEFENYMAVGNNSGPNQAALYSGMPLEGREGIRSSTSHKAGRTWIWDRLNDAGYVTLKAEDGCISNSNMVQSIRPQTHHGHQLHGMFCFDYDRPNCLGNKLAAEHLVDYTRQFIRTYNRGNETQSSHQKPWAAFLSFIDSHEDTLTLISYLDGLLLDFLQDVLTNSNTMIIFTSDHGLHYGPAFQSKSAEVERASPVLFLRMPTFENFSKLQELSKLYTTPFDVHATILDVILGKQYNDQTQTDSLGISLATHPERHNNLSSRVKCGNNPAIPTEFCNLLQKSKENTCTFMLDPPSIFSYYSDIPPTNRPRWPRHCPVRRDHTAIASLNKKTPCSCATNIHNWLDCSNTTRDDFRKGINFTEENFSMRLCKLHDLDEADEALEFDIHVKENELVSSSSQIQREETMKELSRDNDKADVKASFDLQPNIIFLEIDSVSYSY